MPASPAGLSKVNLQVHFICLLLSSKRPESGRQVLGKLLRINEVKINQAQTDINNVWLLATDLSYYFCKCL